MACALRSTSGSLAGSALTDSMAIERSQIGEDAWNLGLNLVAQSHGAEPMPNRFPQNHTPVDPPHGWSRSVGQTGSGLE